MTDLTELNKLEAYFVEKGIEYERVDREPCESPYTPYTMERHQLKWKMPQKISDRGINNDVICQYGSYGYEEGLLEGLGSLFEEDVEGYLTADEVINRIEGAILLT